MRTGMNLLVFCSSFYAFVRIVGLVGAIAVNGVQSAMLALALGVLSGMILVVGRATWWPETAFRVWPVLLNLWATSLLTRGTLPTALVGLMMIAWSLHRYEYAPAHVPPAG